MVSTAVVLLAGGEALRFPGKLEHRIDGSPMLARCYDRVRAQGWPIYIAGKASFSRELDARLAAPLVIDRRPGGGPLRAFLDACAMVRAEHVFAIAADQPKLDAAVLRQLAAAWQRGDEAVVPAHDGEIEPLAALYDRKAVLREGFELRTAGKAAMRHLIDRLAARFVPCDAQHFHNVNRREDLP
jgi:molybdopterin-guanine dinucleotide biosynthesis protein A